MSVVIFLGLCTLLALCDWKHRAVPRALPLLGIIFAITLTPWSWASSPPGLIMGFGIALIADLPMGDAMVGAMLGAWVGFEGIMLTWVLALLVGNIIWAAWEDRLINWPGEWPFTPLLLVPSCVIVLAKGGW